MRALILGCLVVLAGCAPYSTAGMPPQAVAYCRYQAARAATVDADIGTMQACLSYIRMTGELPR